MPLKSNVNIKFEPYTEIERSETAESVRNVRILLNKLAKENFARIADTLLNNFKYNGEILQELTRILLNKCIKESNYIEVYMTLVDQLLHKFRMPTKTKPLSQGQIALDFRRMVLEQCQTIFEHQESEEFLKDLPGDLDEEEKKLKRKQRVSGNTKLIGQLFIRGVAGEKIVMKCFEKFLNPDTEDNVENACHLLLTIGKRLYECYAFDAKLTTSKKRPKIKTKIISKEYFDDCIDKLVSYKQLDKMSSRIKFMIQDVTEARDQEWNNAFNQFPAPKKAITSTEAVIAYRKKTKSIEKADAQVSHAPVLPVLQEALPSDPKLDHTEARKKSINETNVFGKSIEKYKKTQIAEKFRVHYMLSRI